MRVGTDIVPVARISAMMERRGEGFTARWFTPAEIAYCSSRAHPARHFAVRLAAKEATFKALRLGSEGPIPWLDIEVERGADGAPAIRLSGNVARLARLANVWVLDASLSHTAEFATATVLAAHEPEAGLDRASPAT